MISALGRFYRYCVYLPLALLWTLLSLLLLLVSSVLNRRFAVQQVPALWARALCKTVPLQVELSGVDNIDPEQSYIVVANHASQLDIPLIAGWLPLDLRWVAKAELKIDPIVGTACRIMGNIFIDRRDTEAAIASLKRASDILVNGTSLMFFPEGTRSRAGQALPFKKGAFVIAKDLSLPILMVSIVNADAAMPKGTLVPRSAHIDVVIHAPLAAAEVVQYAPAELASKCQETVFSVINQG